MKKMIIWRRLNTALALLIFLLVVGAGLAWWVEHNRSISFQRSNLLTSETGKVRLQLAQMSDAFRGQVLDPKNEVERKRGADAEKELGVVLDTLQSQFGKYPGLAASIRSIRDFVSKTLIPYQNKILDETDPAIAASQYAKSYPSIRRARKTLADLI